MSAHLLGKDWSLFDTDQPDLWRSWGEMTSISVPTDPQDPGWVRCKNRWKRRCDWHVRTAETGPDGTCFSGIVFERHRAHFRLPACKGILEGRNWTRVGAFTGQKSVTLECPRRKRVNKSKSIGRKKWDYVRKPWSAVSGGSSKTSITSTFRTGRSST